MQRGIKGLPNIPDKTPKLKWIFNYTFLLTTNALQHLFYFIYLLILVFWLLYSNKKKGDMLCIQIHKS